METDMPESEPTPWELMRVLRAMDAKLDQVVTKDMFQAESKRVDERLGEVSRDVTDERVAREKALSAEKLQREQELAFERTSREKAVSAEREAREKAWADQNARADKLATNLKWLASAILIPIALFLIDRLGGS